MNIQAPTNCPSCNSVLEFVKDQLYCYNLSCPAKVSKIVENFAKKMKIKGLGPSTIKKLNLTSILDIYRISLQEILEVLGTTLGNKLYLEIEKSKRASLNQVLPSLNISLIGQSATDKLCAVVENIDQVDEGSCKKAGLGPVATANLLDFLENNEDWKYLPFSWISEKPKQYSKTVCISGKLKTYKTKAQAKEALEKLGYKISDSVTKNTDILVNESELESLKTAKARELGIPIITNLKQLLKE